MEFKPKYECVMLSKKHSESSACAHYLLFVVITGHVQNKQAITEGADRNTYAGSFNEQGAVERKPVAWQLTSDL